MILFFTLMFSCVSTPKYECGKDKNKYLLEYILIYYALRRLKCDFINFFATLWCPNKHVCELIVLDSRFSLAYLMHNHNHEFAWMNDFDMRKLLYSHQIVTIIHGNNWIEYIDKVLNEFPSDVYFVNNFFTRFVQKSSNHM